MHLDDDIVINIIILQWHTVDIILKLVFTCMRVRSCKVEKDTRGWLIWGERRLTLVETGSVSGWWWWWWWWRRQRRRWWLYQYTCELLPENSLNRKVLLSTELYVVP